MQTTRSAIFAFHLLILPLLVVIGLYGRKSPQWMFSILVGIGILGVLYHSFQLYNSISKEKEDSKEKN
tara:strand:+ start:286 stop:489 length:204 start_codon:yes stop_codon:yes gene_type:complete